MDVSEKRIVGSLILLLGLSALTIALYAGQIEEIARLMSEIFPPAMAGLP